MGSNTDEAHDGKVLRLLLQFISVTIAAAFFSIRIAIRLVESQFFFAINSDIYVMFRSERLGSITKWLQSKKLPRDSDFAIVHTGPRKNPPVRV